MRINKNSSEIISREIIEDCVLISEDRFGLIGSSISIKAKVRHLFRSWKEDSSGCVIGVGGQSVEQLPAVEMHGSTVFAVFPAD